MASLSERLAAVKAKVSDGRDDNLQVVKLEKEATPITTEFHSRTDSVLIIKKRKRSLTNNATTASIDVGSADEADEENDDERLRSMKRRSRALSHLSASASAATTANDKHDDGTVIVYGGDAKVDEQAVNAMVDELQCVEKRRLKYRRRRTFNEEGADITFINEGNRVFNQTLERHFDKFESVKKIKENLERGTA